MKTQKISITANLETSLILRLFLLDYRTEVMHQHGDLDNHYGGDYVLPDDFDYSSHEKIMKKVRKVTKEESGTGYLRNSHSLVIAYQVLYVSSITDERSEYGHSNTSTQADVQSVTEKVFIFGEPISKNEIEVLVAWVNVQKKLDAEDRQKEDVWLRKGVSFYTPDGAAKVLDKEASLFLKIGEATFAVLPNKENFKPYLPVTANV